MLAHLHDQVVLVVLLVLHLLSDLPGSRLGSSLVSATVHEQAVLLLDLLAQLSPLPLDVLDLL